MLQNRQYYNRTSCIHHSPPPTPLLLYVYIIYIYIFFPGKMYIEMHKSYQDPSPCPQFQSCLAEIWLNCLPDVNAIDGFPAVSYRELNHPSLDLGLLRKEECLCFQWKSIWVPSLAAALLPIHKCNPGMPS